ncbi:putative gag/pol/env polyprotein [Sesbania bispinosa]|nr:putative gag/pol/env polyprotein [Sesbania bispinosa]
MIPWSSSKHVEKRSGNQAAHKLANLQASSSLRRDWAVNLLDELKRCLLLDGSLYTNQRSMMGLETATHQEGVLQISIEVSSPFAAPSPPISDRLRGGSQVQSREVSGLG